MCVNITRLGSTGVSVLWAREKRPGQHLTFQAHMAHRGAAHLWSDSTRFQSGQTTCQESLYVVRASAECPEQSAMPPNAEAIPSRISRSGTLRVRDGVRSYLGKVTYRDASESMRTTTPAAKNPRYSRDALVRIWTQTSSELPINRRVRLFSRCSSAADAHVALWCFHHTPGRLYSSFFLCTES